MVNGILFDFIVKIHSTLGREKTDTVLEKTVH